MASSDMSYEDDTLTPPETDATSHASSEMVPAPAASATSQRNAGDTLRPRRLGPDHTFISGPVQVGVQVHRGRGDADDADATDTESVPVERDSPYETIPSEKEFGTLGVVKPHLLRGVCWRRDAHLPI